MIRLIRVFRATPNDSLAYFGPPDRFAEADEVHVDCTFIYDKPIAEKLAEQWRAVLHPGAILREAHLNLLALPSSTIARRAFGGRAVEGELVKAGPGAFVAYLSDADDVSLGGAPDVHVRVRTWLADDMLRESQIPLRDPG
jgi:hypothetical protein